MALMVKICGINSAEAADATVRAGADIAGFAFHSRSPRNVTLDQAVSLGSRMRARLKIAAFFCDPTDEAIAPVMNALKPDFLQLHGSETPARLAAIRARFGVALIKAIAIATPDDLAGIAAYEDAADMLLFDAKPPPGASREGGHGVAFDWQILRGRRFSRPWLLGGGLTPENVARAIAACDPQGVDVSSGVESALGRKDPERVAAFVSAARSARLGAAA
jgi:phosphoribosylanthranilate isomerase